MDSVNMAKLRFVTILMTLLVVEFAVERLNGKISLINDKIIYTSYEQREDYIEWTAEERSLLDIKWTAERNIWNEVLMIWQTTDHLQVISDHKLTDYEFNLALDAWKNKRTTFQYLRFSCAYDGEAESFYLKAASSSTQSTRCVCARYVRQVMSTSWRLVHASKCTSLPQLYPDVFRDFENVLLLDVSDSYTAAALTADAVSKLTSLELVKVSISRVDRDIASSLCNIPTIRAITLVGKISEVSKNSTDSDFINPIFCRNESKISSDIFEMSGMALPRVVLKSLSVINSTRLVSVELVEASIEHIDDDAFYNMSSLLYLVLSHNHIAAINIGIFDCLSSLRVLDLSFNWLTTLEVRLFKKTQNLSYLSVSHNKLQHIDGSFSIVSNLRGVRLSYNDLNQIEGYTFRSCTDLIQIYVDHNSIATMHSSAFDGCLLAILDLSYNRLSNESEIRETFWKMPALPMNLWLEGNNITTLVPVMFQSNSNMSDGSGRMYDFKGFDTSRIKIDDEIKLIMETMHQYIADIVVLNLSANGILNVDFGAFRYLSYLTILDLSRNKISELQEDILSDMFVLYYLNLADNNIKFFPKNMFKTNRKISVLKLSNNVLGNIPTSDQRIGPDLPSGICDLFVQNNYIKDISLYTNDLYWLFALNASGNRVQVIKSNTFFKNPQLRIIDLSNNLLYHLEEEPFRANRYLDHLYLENNHLDLDFSVDYFRKRLGIRLTGLKLLNLAGNNISSTVMLFSKSIKFAETIILSRNPLGTILEQPRNYPDVDSISHSPVAVEHIALRNCNLTNIHESAFELAELLVLLDLSSNRLSEFRPLKLKHADYQIMLQDNPIVCSCRMKWLKSPMYGPHYSVPRCFHSLTGKLELFQSLHESDFLCRIPWNCLNEENVDCVCFANDVEAFGRPSRLDCSNKGNTIFPRNIPSSAIVIRFERNNLREFNQYKASNESMLSGLEELHLDFNRIEKLGHEAFEAFQNLLVVSVTNNHIAYLHARTFSKLLFLKQLYLDNNAIARLSSETFSKLFYIEILTFDNNYLEELDSDTLEVLDERPRLQKLTLDHNPWACSCDNATFKNWIQKHSSIIDNLTDIYCNQTSILSMSDLDFLCYDPKTTISLVTSEYFVGPLVALSLLFALLAIIATVLYRFRYIIHDLAYNQFGFRLGRQQENDECTYDAIAIYDGEQQRVRCWIKDVLLLQMEPRFSLFVADRDLIPGGDRANEMAANIRLSKRTLIIVSSGSHLNRELSFAFETAYDFVKFEKSFHRITCLLLDDTALDEMQQSEQIDDNFKAILGKTDFLLSASESHDIMLDTETNREDPDSESSSLLKHY